jgi:hypothetical protein
MLSLENVFEKDAAQWRDLQSFPEPLQTPNHINEELMNPPITRELRMERSRQQFALPNQDRKTVPLRQNLHPWTHTGNARRTDVDHLQRPSRQLRLARLDGAVDLPPVSIAFHADIHHRQTLLGRLGDIAGKKNTTGASTKSRLLLNETLQRLKQSVPLEKLEKRRRLPTGEDQSIETLQLRGSTYLDGICARLDKSLDVGSKISLDGEHPYARTLQVITSRGFAAVHPLEGPRSRDLASPRSSAR